MNLIAELFTGETGQGMVEYAFILMLVALAVIAGLGSLGNAIAGVFSRPELTAIWE